MWKFSACSSNKSERFQARCALQILSWKMGESRLGLSVIGWPTAKPVRQEVKMWAWWFKHTVTDTKRSIWRRWSTHRTSQIHLQVRPHVMHKPHRRIHAVVSELFVWYHYNKGRNGTHKTRWCVPSLLLPNFLGVSSIRVALLVFECYLFLGTLLQMVMLWSYLSHTS